MNKMLRRNHPISSPKEDIKTSHIRGTTPGNMMGYDIKPEPATSHTEGAMPGNMMQYPQSKSPSSYPPLSDESKDYGNAPLKEPTRSGFNGKTMPSQMQGYSKVNFNNPEWTKIQSTLKKGK